MTSIAENNKGDGASPNLICDDDWLQLVRLATEKDRFITTIKADETGPQRKKTAQAAYERFQYAVSDHVSCPTRAA